MPDKKQILELAKAHFINLKSSSAVKVMLSILNAEYPTSDREEKVRRITLITDVVTSL